MPLESTVTILAQRIHTLHRLRSVFDLSHYLTHVALAAGPTRRSIGVRLPGLRLGCLRWPHQSSSHGCNSTNMERSRRYVSIPSTGLSASDASKLVREHLALDSEPSMNIAGYHTTSMERGIEDIILEHLPKNITHHEAYPASNEIERDCVTMIAELFNSPVDADGPTAVGTSTIGSSEAIILAVLAAKRRWEKSQTSRGKSTNSPNMITSSAAHVCWIKAALYLGIELRYCGISSEDYVMDVNEAIHLVDENTVLVGAILGSSAMGAFDDVERLNDLLLKKNLELDLDVTIHVDAASGGFVAPFIAPDLIWDFRLPLVGSINASGHKLTSLTYASVGWALWRSRTLLPKELLFTVDYCGSRSMVSLTLNFSKSAVFVIAQYYQLLRLGKSGYRAIMSTFIKTAQELAQGIAKTSGGSLFRVMSGNERCSLPVVVWQLQKKETFDEYTIAQQLRARGWVVPAYGVHTSRGSVTVMRVIVRAELTAERSAIFLADLSGVCEALLNE